MYDKIITTTPAAANNNNNLTREVLEYIEMFQMFDKGAYDLLMKINVKKWEYSLYGGRLELYPQDKRVLYTMIKFRNERVQKERKRADKEQEMKQKMKSMS